MTAGLAAFLTARLAEDEAEARKLLWMIGHASAGGLAVESAKRRADRALREVAAKRAILAEHARARNEQGDTLCFTCTEGPWPCKTIRHLTAVYSGHPDYRPAWNPEEL